MSTSAISPIQSVDFGASSATSSQKGVFNDLIVQLEQAIGGGDLSTTQTLLNAVEALSPSSSGSSDALGAFLKSLGKALGDNSVNEAQVALATYQDSSVSSSPSSTPSAETSRSTSTSIAGGLVLSQIQLNLVSSLLGGGSSSGNSGSSSSSDSLLSLVNAAYSSAEGNSSDSSTSTVSATTPFDTLVSAIQANLTSGSGAAEALLSYLSPTGNFVNTTA